MILKIRPFHLGAWAFLSMDSLKNASLVSKVMDQEDYSLGWPKGDLPMAATTHSLNSRATDNTLSQQSNQMMYLDGRTFQGRQRKSIGLMDLERYGMIMDLST